MEGDPALANRFTTNLEENGFTPLNDMEERDRRDTFVGTPLYVSPEMLEQNKSLPANDLWALGCIIYRMHVGEVPFKASNENAVFQKIINRDVEFPPDMEADTKDIIDKLLQVKPETRLGAGSPDSDNNYAALMKHPYFEGIDFETIKNRAVPMEME